MHALRPLFIWATQGSSDQNLYQQTNNESSFDRTLFMGRQPTAQVCDEIYAHRSLRLGETQGRGIEHGGKMIVADRSQKLPKLYFVKEIAFRFFQSNCI